MRNLTIKKVALGVFLAGYAASSAFAAPLVSTTTNTIVGNLPALSTKGTDPLSNSPTWTIHSSIVSSTVSGQVGYIGDKILFEFVTTDVDGDTPAATPAKDSLGSEGTFRVMYYKDNAWVEASDDSYNYVANGKIEFTLKNDAGGASKIGYKIQAKTQYGAPRDGLWISGDTLAAAAPTTPSTTPPTNPGTGGTGDGGVDGPKHPVPSVTAKKGIFKSGGPYTKTDNYADPTNTTLTPKLAETYELVYWDDKTPGTDGDFEATDQRFTPSTIQWQVVGGNAAANGGYAATATDLTGQTAATIALPALNSGTDSWFTTKPEAGVQGFKLQVTFE
ncbi:hypothetical protein PT273_09445 [Orbaceae bacterium ESL0727]|nr:hypothetical protein [Orbaceae bacterium ESL0727]